MSHALGNFPAKSRHSLYTLQITYIRALTTLYVNHLFTCVVSLTRVLNATVLASLAFVHLVSAQ